MRKQSTASLYEVEAQLFTLSNPHLYSGRTLGMAASCKTIRFASFELIPSHKCVSKDIEIAMYDTDHGVHQIGMTGNNSRTTKATIRRLIIRLGHNHYYIQAVQPMHHSLVCKTIH